MELGEITEQGAYTVWVDVSGVEDLGASNTWVIRPDKFILVYRWYGDGPWKLSDAKVFGGRVLSSGRLGKERGERTWYLGSQVRPAWLEQLIGRFRPTDRDVHAVLTQAADAVRRMPDV